MKYFAEYGAGESRKNPDRTYFVADDNGNIAGHDLDFPTAEHLLDAMLSDEPKAGWEILSDVDDEG